LPGVDKFERASLVTRLTNDVTQVQFFINGMMRFFMRAPLLSIGGVIMAAQLRSPRMNTVLYVIIPISVAVISLSIKIGYPFFYKVQVLLDNLNANVREYLSGVRVVKAFNRFEHEERRFDESNASLTSASASAMQVMAFFGPAISLTVNLGIAAVIWIGGSAGEEQGNIVAFINYMNQIMFALSMFSMIFNQLVRALVSGRRIEEVLKEKEGMDTSGKHVLPTIKQGVTYNNVVFQYESASAPVLTGISFHATPGQTVGIIGSTGAGKSTLVNLLPRFYDVTEGAVLIDDTDIREMDIRSLRDRVAIAPQQTTLFTGTIADNLRWGKADASEEEMWSALRAAQAEFFVRGFPEGLETALGQAGVNLSGGQKQRLSIARELIKKPDILILDDCTSAVDVTTEAAIRRTLRDYAKNIICFIISQRICSIRNADIIIALDNGKIAGMGSHQVLMEKCSVYRDIFISQLGKEAVV
jgi:ATP-binding cassette subfamily B protein